MSEELPVPAESDDPDQPQPAGTDDVAVFKRAIEAIVMVAHDPVAPDLMAQLLEQPIVSVERWCDELQAEYAADGRGFQLARVAGGYRYQTHPDETPYVERFVLNDQRARLSGAALETLAIVAYKQPISRAQVASIRGVDPDGVIRTLAARGYIDEVARDDGPGQAVLFGTTPLFLEKLGLDSLDDLPPIAEFIPDADVVEALEHGLRVRPEIEEIATTELVSEADAQVNASSDGAPTESNGRVPVGDRANIDDAELPVPDAIEVDEVITDDVMIEVGIVDGLGTVERVTDQVIVDELVSKDSNAIERTVSERETVETVDAVIAGDGFGEPVVHDDDDYGDGDGAGDVVTAQVGDSDRAAAVFETLRAEQNNGELNMAGDSDEFDEFDELDELDEFETPGSDAIGDAADDEFGSRSTSPTDPSDHAEP